MKIIAPFLLILSLVCLTSPDGFAVWVEKAQVVSVFRAIGCPASANTQVSLGNGLAVCVQEDRKTVVKKIEEAK